MKNLEPKQKISVLLVEPNKSPRMIEMEDTLEAMQKIVGGEIEQYMPFDDEAAIVCNAEGKMNGLTLNRAIFLEMKGEKKLTDIMAGTFFICNAPIESERYLSLTPAQQKKYMERFRHPEVFYVTPNGILIKKMMHKDKEMER